MTKTPNTDRPFTPRLDAALRLTAALAFAVCIAASPVSAQNELEIAADEAEQVASEAYDAIRAIDPTTGGPSPVIDPSLPAPYGADIATGEEAENIMDALPPLTGAITAPSAPRGPAARTIAPRPQTLASNTAVTNTASALPIAPPITRASPAQAYVEEQAPAPVIESSDPFVIKSILPISGSIRYGEWYWDETRAPEKGKLVVTVDLEARIISVFRDGHEIGTSVALLGTKKHPTPLGVFPILTKEIDNVSEKYNNAPMPYTLRLTWSGIAIHGSPVLNGYASHGCIGVPDDFAEKLFAIAKRGDKVVITKGNMVGLGHKML